MTKPPLTWTIFVLLRTRPAWLQLSRQRRNELASAAFEKALASDRLSLRYYDAEAMTGRCTDIAVFETTDLKTYYFAMEELRDSPLFAEPYFEVVEILPALEEGFRTYEREAR